MTRAFWARHYQRGRVSFLLLAITFAGLVKFTWLKYGDMIIDTGRELYVPAKLAGGALLYKDIFYLYGPFSPYFNALLYKIFGVHITSLLIGGIITAALTTCLVYKLSRLFLSVLIATFTAFVFLTGLAFSHYNDLGIFNFILPYSYPATHAILFALGCFYFFFRSLNSPRKGRVILTGLLLFLSLLTRLEVGFMLGASIAFAILINTRSRSRAGMLIPCVILPLAAAGAVFAGFTMASAGKLNNSNMWDLLKSNTNTFSPFTALLAGTDAPMTNLRLMANATFSYIVLVVWSFTGAWFIRMARGSASPFIRANRFTVMILMIGGIFLYLDRAFNFEHQYRPLPVIYLLTIFLSKDIKLTALSLFAFLLGTRMLLNMHPWHYGFFILVPGLIVYHAFFFRIIPDHFKFSKRTLYAAFLVMLGIFLARHMLVSRSYYGWRTLPAVSEKGTLTMLNADRERGCLQLVAFLREHTLDTATVVVFPEGLTINFLAGRDNPLYYYSYLPQDLARDSVNNAIVGELKAKNVDYIVLVNRPLEEYGKHAFGKDYAQKIWNYVSDNYTPHAGIGPTPYTSESHGQFSARIYRRNK